AERSTSRSVRIPARNRPCMTTAEPTFACTMTAAASATDVSGEVSATRMLIRSRRTVMAAGPASATAAHLVQFSVERGAGGLRAFLGQHPPQRAGPRRQMGPFLPEDLQSRLVELGIGTLRRDGVPDLLKVVNHVEELAR